MQKTWCRPLQTLCLLRQSLWTHILLLSGPRPPSPLTPSTFPPRLLQVPIGSCPAGLLRELDQADFHDSQLHVKGSRPQTHKYLSFCCHICSSEKSLANFKVIVRRHYSWAWILGGLVTGSYHIRASHRRLTTERGKNHGGNHVDSQRSGCV